MSAILNRATMVRIAAVLASFLMISVLVVTGSRAAFIDSTDNAANTFSSAAGVTLTDDDGGSTLFTVTGLTPGARVENCIQVTFAGASPNADIRMFAGASAPGTLVPVLDIEVTIGSGEAFSATELGGGEGDCSTFVPGAVLNPLGDLSTFLGNTTFASAPVGWNTSTPQGNVQTYRIVVEMDATADNSYANQPSGEMTFVWEAQG